MARTTLMRRRARGQAVVELVLGLIVFVTVLIFAIHFAEVGFLSVKVTEAQHSALFDATGYKLHTWPTNTQPSKNAVSKATSDANKRYGDFDSLTSSNKGKTVSEVFTRARSLNVQCKLGGGPSYSQGSATTNAYGDNGGVNCQTSAEVSAIGIPQHFLDQGKGFFKEQQYKPLTIPVCGIGRGNCSRAKLTMLLDDWGLMGAKESKNCQMSMDSPGCQNSPFWDMSESVYKKNGGSVGMMGTMFAVRIVGMSPVNESQFWMSAEGEEKTFNQKISSEGTKQFYTTPYLKEYQQSYSKRSTCWLGVKCP